MREIKIAKGMCLGIGGTNARVALCYDGQVEGFKARPTPRESTEFFRWVAEQLLDGYKNGARWAVIGVPGPAIERHDKHIIGPLHNLPGLADQSYILEDQLVAVNPQVKELLDEGFTLAAVNDGTLAAFASAELYGKNGETYYTIASFIIGTGVGGSLVRRVHDSDIFRPSKSLFEIGHIPLPHDASSTFERTISGPALEKHYGKNPRDFGPDHEAWKEVGNYVGQLIMMASLVAGADLVVACGGVGSNYYEYYRPHLEAYLEQYKNSANAVHRLAVPKMVAVPHDLSHTFEMHGAEGLMKYYMAQAHFS